MTPLIHSFKIYQAFIAKVIAENKGLVLRKEDDQLVLDIFKQRSNEMGKRNKELRAKMAETMKATEQLLGKSHS
jgi:hypothetical protein